MELTLDQQRAIALANARMRATQPAPDNPYSATNIAGAAIEPNLSMLSGMVATPLAGLAGLAGTVLPGPAGQGADWARDVSSALTYQPRTSGGKIAQQVISYPFQKLGQAGDWAGGKVTDLTGSPELGTAVNTAVNVGVPMALAAALRGEAPQNTLAGKAAINLMQRATKPTLADLRSGDAERAMITMLDEGISPTTGGMDKVSRLTRSLNDQVSDIIANSDATVNVPTAGGYLRRNWNDAVNQVSPDSDMAAVRAAWDEFRNSPQISGKVDIPVQTAHAIKQGTYRALGNKSYGEIGTAFTEAQKRLAAGLRGETIAAVPEVKAPLAREADLMNVRDVAERRALLQSNLDPQGLAALRIDNPYAWMNFMASRSAAAKAALARILYSSANPRTAIGAAAVSEEK